MSRTREPRAVETKTVLLVEDDEQVRLFMIQALEARGYVVLSARNGRDALDVLRRDEAAIDALITKYQKR